MFKRFFAKKNSCPTPLAWTDDQAQMVSEYYEKQALIASMNEKRPLPMGMAEFEEWSARIIQGAMLSGVTHESQKFALADMIMHLGPTEDFKEDGYFIKMLRKVAINQIADAKRKEIRDAAKARLGKAQEEEAARMAAVSGSNQDGDVTPTKDGEPKDVLENPSVP